MPAFQYDYLVIGGGSGGVSSAKRAAAEYGKRVAIVESLRWGGTCVNVGCVPKKIMWQAATLSEMIRHDAKEYELETNNASGRLNWKAMRDKRDKYIERLNGIYQSGLEKAGVEVLEGWASFTGQDPHTVQVSFSDGASPVKTITAEHILIATGGKPMLPTNTPGIPQHCITSDGFFQLEELPNKVVVVGAGYIAVELAGVLNALGAETHLVLRKHKALRTFDEEISDFLDAEMVRQGIIVHRNTSGVAKIESNNNLKTVTCVNGTVLDKANVVLMAPGRVPNIDGLNLDKIGVNLSSRGGSILSDEYQNTSVSNIYAVGDVASNGFELTPMAIAAGRRLADRLFGEKLMATSTSIPKTSYENVPSVVFSHPVIGTCGLTEEKAIAKYGSDNIKVYRSTFVNLYYATFASMQPSEKPKSFFKLVCAGVEEQVVGLHCIGMGSDEFLQGFGLAMKMGATKADFDSCIAIHPTAAEEVVTMGTWGTSPQYSGAKVPPLMGAAAPEPTLLHSRNSDNNQNKKSKI